MPSLLTIIIAAIAIWWLLGKPKLIEGFSPGTVVQVHPSHNKKYYDSSKYRLNQEQFGAAKLGPLAPIHVLRAQDSEATDPCFEDFETPFGLDSLESHMQVGSPSSGISTNMV